MGKKSKRNKQQAAASRGAAGSSAETVPNKVKREVLEIVNQLLDSKCGKIQTNDFILIMFQCLA